jgi:hypothetical protein
MTPTPFAAHRARPITPNVESAPPDPAAAQRSRSPAPPGRHGAPGRHRQGGTRMSRPMFQCAWVVGSSDLTRVSRLGTRPLDRDRRSHGALPPTVTLLACNSLMATRGRNHGKLAGCAGRSDASKCNSRPTCVPRAGAPREVSHADAGAGALRMYQGARLRRMQKTPARISSTRFAIPSWRRSGSRISGGLDPGPGLRRPRMSRIRSQHIVERCFS